MFDFTLNDQQKKAAYNKDNVQALLVTAGAGTGKTSTIIARVRYMLEVENKNPKDILLVTFTRKAAGEMKSRIKNKDITVKTFHGFCYYIMMQKFRHFFNIGNLNILSEGKQYYVMLEAVKKYSRDNKFSKFAHKRDVKVFSDRQKLIEISSYASNICKRPKDVLSFYKDISKKEKRDIIGILKIYEKLKKQGNMMDYDDILKTIDEFMFSDKTIRDSITDLYSDVLVDEMQDTNPRQFNLLSYFYQSGSKLFCVGDPAQSIYGFRGAIFNNIYNFTKIFPNSDNVRLSENFRSSQEILNISNWLLSNSNFKYKNSLNSFRGYDAFKPTLTVFENQLEESKMIVNNIQRRVNLGGEKLKDIMLLTRTHVDSFYFQSELISSKIRFNLNNCRDILFDERVMDIICIFCLYLNKNYHTNKIRYDKLLSYDAFLENPMDIIRDNSSNVGRCVSKITAFLLPTFSEKYKKRNPINIEIVDIINAAAKKYDNLIDFIDDFSPNYIASGRSKHKIKHGVFVSTVHGAKGLEFDTCYTVSITDGVYPHVKSWGVYDYEEEERRILYVALTRARKNLIMTSHIDTKIDKQKYKELLTEPCFLSQLPDDLFRLVNSEDFYSIVSEQETKVKSPPKKTRNKKPSIKKPSIKKPSNKKLSAKKPSKKKPSKKKPDKPTLF